MKKTSLAIFLVAVLAVAYAAYLAIAFAAQPPLDLHAFRQAQTALTTYWLAQDGFKLAYETPVVGPPFAIPFEFPIYQAIVAGLWKVSGLPLDVVGRLTSFAFLLLCVLPARSITRNLQLPRSVFWIFVALLFSSPIYVYWGRSFLIETAALFFAVAAIGFFVDYLFASRSARSLLLFAVFATLAVLQKATTWLPVVPVLGLAYLLVEGKRPGSLRDLLVGRRALLVAAGFFVPIALGFVWVRFSDQVKLLNPLGQQMTSVALSRWNFGSFLQRTSGDIWTTVVWRRLLVPNLGALLGLFLLAAPFLVRTQARVRWIALAALALGILPLFVFTNLHLVHTYYQSANAIYLLFAVAVALGAVVLPRLGSASAMLMLAVILVGNHAALDSEYMGALQQRFTEENRDVAVGGILKREVPADKVFVAFGNDWSSTFAYMAQRKSFTVPRWFKGYTQIAQAPERFVGPGQLGAVVSCSVPVPNAADVAGWASLGRSWKVGETQGCVIAVPQKTMESGVDGTIACQGKIDVAQVAIRYGHRMLSVAGWTAPADSRTTLAERVFLSVSARGAPATYFDTLKVPGPDVKEQLLEGEVSYSGFTRLIPGDWKPGEYELGVVQYASGRYQACQLKKQLVVE
ncbi:hypothetical protein [Ramlibacter sp.]|uniref:ArnT family glycosyltransferase n=1 Tax=Ramlibacter sp. TaxID=1917967 RepID=UPI002636E44D|nr:hypothetical protein [Ramlibacter sp.]MDB5955150.1 glycosyl transferase family protein [Ramlibacter sp.]